MPTGGGNMTAEVNEEELEDEFVNMDEEAACGRWQSDRGRIVGNDRERSQSLRHLWTPRGINPHSCIPFSTGSRAILPWFIRHRHPCSVAHYSMLSGYSYTTKPRQPRASIVLGNYRRYSCF